MKIYTSYFYQIRFFKPNQIPVSTAVWDPKWFHEFKDQDHIFVDKNGVINGIRLEYLNPKRCNAGGCPCEVKDPSTCWFIKSYKKGLERWNFNDIYGMLSGTAEYVQRLLGFSDEPEIMLIVHEAPDNPCSERAPLQEYFKEHGINVEEYEKTS